MDGGWLLLKIISDSTKSNSNFVQYVHIDRVWMDTLLDESLYEIKFCKLSSFSLLYANYVSRESPTHNFNSYENNCTYFLVISINLLNYGFLWFILFPFTIGQFHFVETPHTKFTKLSVFNKRKRGGSRMGLLR